MNGSKWNLQNVESWSSERNSINFLPLKQSHYNVWTWTVQSKQCIFLSKTILDKSLFGKLKPVKQIYKYKELRVNKDKTDTVTRTGTFEVLAPSVSPPALSGISRNALETPHEVPSLSEKEVPSLSLTSHVLDLGISCHKCYVVSQHKFFALNSLKKKKIKTKLIRVRKKITNIYLKPQNIFKWVNTWGTASPWSTRLWQELNKCSRERTSPLLGSLTGEGIRYTRFSKSCSREQQDSSVICT